MTGDESIPVSWSTVHQSVYIYVHEVSLSKQCTMRVGSRKPLMATKARLSRIQSETRSKPALNEYKANRTQHEYSRECVEPVDLRLALRRDGSGEVEVDDIDGVCAGKRYGVSRNSAPHYLCKSIASCDDYHDPLESLPHCSSRVV